MRTLDHLGDLSEFIEFGLDRTVPLWGHPMPGIVLHLGPGQKIIDGGGRWTVVELGLPEWNADIDQMPIADGTVGAVFATHFFEHLADPRVCLEECARVMRSGAPLNIMVPHGQSLAYLQDLDHKTPFVIDTWRNLLENPYYDNGGGFPFRIGANFTFAIAERNTMLVTQLIRM